ncbi:MAG: apolipoprotein N-acyltransferase, partial [Acidobacteria bacterium]|nr:apolipoprotein N-acyltransferase [Acidobacteriota bacterium]
GGVLIRHWFGVPACALLWPVLERTQEPATLFGWLMLGDAAIDLPGPLRLAPWTGVHGISFLFAATAGAFAAILLRQPRRRAAWAALATIPLLLPPLPVNQRPSAHAAVVQPNLDAEGDWTSDRYEAAKRTMAAESIRALREGPVEVVLWPETPGPMYFERDRDLQARVAGVAAAAGVPVLLGALSHDAAGDARNAALLVSREGSVKARYDKMYLVPFGEYVPSLFGFVNQVTDEAGAYSPGDTRTRMPLGAGVAGAFICYEAAVGPHVRDFAREGAQVFLNLSNDGYFFRTPAREQHLQLARMRAVENGRWLIRATNNGLSVSIDPAGTVRERLAPFQMASGRFGFGFVTETTFYTAYGDWFVLLGALVVCVCLVASQLPHYSPRRQGL